jgi:hypothetical protein
MTHAVSAAMLKTGDVILHENTEFKVVSARRNSAEQIVLDISSIVNRHYTGRTLMPANDSEFTVVK